jgi:hypothetical protein
MFAGHLIGPIESAKFPAGVGPMVLAPLELPIFSSVLSPIKLPILTPIFLTNITGLGQHVISAVSPSAAVIGISPSAMERARSTVE